MPTVDVALAETQRQHWNFTYCAKPHMYGWRPSESACYAAGAFHDAGARTVLELGAGHGRDSLYFANCGYVVHALDFSRAGLDQLREGARIVGVTDRVTTTVHDVRKPLPVSDGEVDAVYAHMLLSMALSTDEIAQVVDEVARVLRPGGLFVYTVRNTHDPHNASGTDRGGGIFERSGFAVHFFDMAMVEALAAGWQLHEVADAEEGELPRRLWRVLQSKTVPRQLARFGTPRGSG